MIVYMDVNRHAVAKLGGVWCQLDSVWGVWRTLKQPPDIDLDFTQRWFGYTKVTMIRARAELSE